MPRLKANSFTLYGNLGTPLDLTEQLRRNWEPGKVLEYHAYFRKGKELLPIRICAMGKTQEQFEKSQRNSTKCNHGRKKASALQSIWNRYIVVATSLPEAITAEQVLELYQMRWQIELVFKRFKSIFKGDTFAVQKQDTVQAWFYGKLLLAILSEALAKRGHFSPSDEGKEV